MTDIIGFFNEHRYLSNFYTEAPFVDLSSIHWKTTEHYYQAHKATNKKDFMLVHQAPTPGLAKRYGRQITVRADWEQVKYTIMLQCVIMKFRQNPDIQKKLLNTGSAHLEEANHWGDRVWGTVNGEGKNWLGKVLMDVRDTLRMEQFYE